MVPRRFRPMTKKERETLVSSPKIEFMKRNEMLLDEEIEGVMNGAATIDGYRLLLLNMRSCGRKPGERIRLYQGRRTEILGRRLLGLTDEV